MKLYQIKGIWKKHTPNVKIPENLLEELEGKTEGCKVEKDYLVIQTEERKMEYKKNKKNEKKGTKHKLTVTIEDAVFSEEKYFLYSMFQEQVHNDMDHSRKGFTRFLCDSPLIKEEPRDDNDPPCGLGFFFFFFFFFFF